MQSLHICITSKQTLANLIPVYQQKPAHLVLLTSTSTQRYADMIERAIKAYPSLSTQTSVIHNAPDKDLTAITTFGRETIVQLRNTYPVTKIYLNATGGKKLMALGLIEGMRDQLDGIYYVDTAEQQIEYLLINQQSPAPQQMQNVLTVAQYLKAQGFDQTSHQSADHSYVEGIVQRAPVTEQLAQYAQGFDRANLISSLNYQIQQQSIRKQQVSKYQVRLDFKMHYLSRGLLNQWFKVFELGQQAGLFTWQRDKLLLQFDDPAIAAYLNGGWLEEYVYLCAQSLLLYDVNLNVKVQGGAEIENEFDVLITHQNRMLVVECKTVNLKASSTQKNRHKRLKANEIAYKFDSLSDEIKGLYGDRWLVSSSSVGMIADRAKQLGFTVIAPADLPSIKQKLKAWAGTDG